MSEKIKEAKQQAVSDGFANFVSKVGANPGQNNQISQSQYVFNMLTRNRITLEAMYRGSWVIGKIIDTVADDMTRAGVTITSPDGAEQIEELNTSISRLRIWDSMNFLVKWGNLYGGAIGVLLIEGQDFSTPLDIDRVGQGQFKGIKVFDRWQVTPDLTNLIQSGVDMGLPKFYNLVVSSTSLDSNSAAALGFRDGMSIHHSRVIRQTGIDLPYFQAITEMMWGESVIERIFDRLVAFDNATMSSANLINHANLTNIGIKDFREVVASGGKAVQGLEAQFEMMRYMRSNEGLTIVDAEDIITNTQYSFAGLDDLLLNFGQQLSGASDIPLVKFFGQSPAGLNATGDSDIRNYYDGINSKQESKFRPGIDKVLKVAYKSLFGVPAPADMQFTFTALWQMSDKEKAEIGKAIAETISGVFAAGLITRSAALKELKHQSAQTGLFTNISDEDIAEAEKTDTFEDPPAPGGDKEDPDKKEKKPVKDSISAFLRKFTGK